MQTRVNLQQFRCNPGRAEGGRGSWITFPDMRNPPFDKDYIIDFIIAQLIAFKIDILIDLGHSWTEIFREVERSEEICPS